MLNFFIEIKKKSISPLIATILLIVISVLIIWAVLSWGKGFSNTSLSSTNNSNSKNSYSGFVWSFETINNNVLIKNNSDKNLSIVGYTINSVDYNYFWINKYHPLENTTIISPGRSDFIPLICMPENKFVLTLKTSTNEFIPLNVTPSRINRGSTCDEYNVPLWSFLVNSGNFSISQYNIVPGELVTNGSFDTDANWTKDVEWSISNGIATYNGSSNSKRISQVRSINVGKMYKVSFSIITNGRANLRFADVSGNTIFNNLPTYITGDYVLYLTSIRSSEVISVWGFNTVNSVDYKTGTAFSIDNISIIEVAPLPNLNSGTKYLENTTAGTASAYINSSQAYGTWEFDVYKNLNTNLFYFLLVSDDTSSNLNAYSLGFDASNRVFFGKANSGTYLMNVLARTNTNYITEKTWYTLKLQRRLNEGIFLDIPNMVLAGDLTFNNHNYWLVGNGSKDWNTTQNCLTLTSTSTAFIYKGGLTNIGDKYIVEFDYRSNNYTGKLIAYGGTTATNKSTDNTTQNWQRARLFIVPNGTTFYIQVVDNFVGTVDIKNIMIRRIYPKDTFALFIKGGQFGYNWTLVSTSGGSGINPVLDSTYTNSNYLISSLYAGDRITNIKMRESIN